MIITPIKKVKHSIILLLKDKHTTFLLAGATISCIACIIAVSILLINIHNLAHDSRSNTLSQAPEITNTSIPFALIQNNKVIKTTPATASTTKIPTQTTNTQTNTNTPYVPTSLQYTGPYTTYYYTPIPTIHAPVITYTPTPPVIHTPAATYTPVPIVTPTVANIYPISFSGNKRVKVLSISYDPVTSNGNYIDTSISGPLGTNNSSLVGLENYVNGMNYTVAQSLTNGTKYHNASIAALGYYVYPIITYKQPIPLSNNLVPWHYNCSSTTDQCTYRPDYNYILNRENICHWVDTVGVRQVWVWGYHHYKTEPVEGDMAMGTDISTYWNYSNYGDISNSEQTNDMPTCNHTYVLYNYDYGRTAGEAVHDHGHQIEAEMSFMDSTLWSKFTSPTGQTGSSINECGKTHFPPNTTTDYDYGNTQNVLSDCMNWQPTGYGLVSTVNCHTWYGSVCDTSDGGLAFYIWWMKQIPGLNNNLSYYGTTLRNWWDVYGDFDSAILAHRGLTN